MKDSDYKPIEKGGEPCKVRDLKEAIRHMEEDDELHLNARVMVYFKNRGRLYGVVGIRHYNILPNLVLEIAKMDKVS